MSGGIAQEPQGNRDVPEPNREGETDKVHSSQAKRSVVTPGDYPEEQREMQSLVTPRRKPGADTPPEGEDDNAPV